MRSRLAALAAALVLAALAASPAAAAKPGPTFSITESVVSNLCSSFSVDVTFTWSGTKANGIEWRLWETPAGTSAASAITQLGHTVQKGSVTIRLTHALAGGSSGNGSARLLLNGRAITAWFDATPATCTTVTAPDLVITGVTPITSGLGDYAYGYAVTPGNAGNGAAPLANVAVQGYYSADGTLDEATDSGACAVSWDASTGDIPAAAGGTTQTGPAVDVYCSAAPPSGTTHLFVIMDVGNIVTESDETNNVFDLAIAG
jgi:hypothetical protein